MIAYSNSLEKSVAVAALNTFVSGVLSTHCEYSVLFALSPPCPSLCPSVRACVCVCVLELLSIYPSASGSKSNVKELLRHLFISIVSNPAILERCSEQKHCPLRCPVGMLRSSAPFRHLMQMLPWESL